MRKVLFSLLAVIFVAFSVNAQKSVPVTSGVYDGNGSFVKNNAKVVYWEQMEAGTNGWASQDFESDYDAYDNQAADDFVVTSGPWDINAIACYGSYSASGPLDLINVYFYEDNAGLPGTLVEEFLDVPCETELKSGTVTADLPSTVSLADGTYWISIVARMDYGTAGQWYWTESTSTNGSVFAWQNPGNGFCSGYTTWTDGQTALGATSTDICFGLYQNVSGYSVTFNVDMQPAIDSALFTPGTDIVYVTGSYCGWAEPGTDEANQLMTDVDEDNIYTFTTSLVDGEYLYKYFLNAGWDGGEWAGDPNRVFTVAGADVTLNDVWGVIVSLKEFDANISVSPNPTTNVLNVTANQNFDVTVIDITGKVVKEAQMSNNAVSIDMTNENAGIYIIRLTNENGSASYKIIKK